jgi:Tfp pilus assembly protein PilX
MWAGHLERRQRGSALITVLILAAVTAVIGASLISHAALESRLATRSLFQAVALNLAEGGIEEGLYALNRGSFASADGWSVASDSTSSFVKTITGIALTQATGEIYVRVDAPSGSAPTVVAAGLVRIPNQPPLAKQVRIGTRRRKPWSNGMVAKNDITFSVASSVDSYDSSVGAYNASTNRTDRATIATNSAAVGAIELTGASSIYGYVATGGSDPTVALGRIYGATSPGVPASPTSYVDPARVRRDFATNLPNIAAPTGTGYNLGNLSVGFFGVTNLPRTGDTPGANGRYLYFANSVSVSLLGTLNVKGPVDLVVSGNTTVALGGQFKVGGSGSTDPSLNLYANGNVSLSVFANEIAATSISPEKATIWGTNTTAQTISISVLSSFTGTIYAPNATLNLSLGADIYGAMVAKDVNVSVYGQFHWDSRLANVEADGFGYGVSAWAELSAAAGSGSAFARDRRAPFNTIF